MQEKIVEDENHESRYECRLAVSIRERKLKTRVEKAEKAASSGLFNRSFFHPSLADDRTDDLVAVGS